MPLAGTYSIPPFPVPRLDEKSLAHSPCRFNQSFHTYTETESGGWKTETREIYVLQTGSCASGAGAAGLFSAGRLYGQAALRFWKLPEAPHPTGGGGFDSY